jgi:hypothetical protein
MERYDTTSCPDCGRDWWPSHTCEEGRMIELATDMLERLDETDAFGLSVEHRAVTGERIDWHEFADALTRMHRRGIVKTTRQGRDGQWYYRRLW